MTMERADWLQAANRFRKTSIRTLTRVRATSAHVIPEAHAQSGQPVCTKPPK
jgi:hypothetical protein